MQLFLDQIRASAAAKAAVYAARASLEGGVSESEHEESGSEEEEESEEEENEGEDEAEKRRTARAFDDSWPPLESREVSDRHPTMCGVCAQKAVYSLSYVLCIVLLRSHSSLYTHTIYWHQRSTTERAYNVGAPWRCQRWRCTSGLTHRTSQCVSCECRNRCTRSMSHAAHDSRSGGP